MQQVGSINTGMQIRNAQILPHVIETNSEDLNASLQQLQDLSVDINAMLTQTLVQLQRVSNQELEEKEQIIGNHLLRSQEKEDELRKDIEAFKKDQC